MSSKWTLNVEVTLADGQDAEEAYHRIKHSIEHAGGVDHVYTNEWEPNR